MGNVIESAWNATLLKCVLGAVSAISGWILNFGRNIAFRPEKTLRPADTAELLRLLQENSRQRMRSRGALHSWSPIIETAGVLFDLREFAWVRVVPGAQPRVRVGAGCTLRRLLCELAHEGFTLPTLGAIKAQTVAGAVATGTHGSGKPSLSHFVESVTFAHLDAGGTAQITRVDWRTREAAALPAARCALGSMGVVVELELAIVPRYRIKESVRKFQSLDQALAGWDSKRWPLTQFALVPWSWVYVVYRRKTSAADGWRLRLRAFIARIYLLLTQDVGLHVLLRVLLVLRLVLRDWFIRRFFRKCLPRMIREMRRVDDSVSILTMHHDWFRHVEMELFIPEPQIDEAVTQIRELIELAGERKPCSPAFAAELRARGLEDAVRSLAGTYTLHYPLFFRRVEEDDALMSMASRSSRRHAWITVSFFTYRCRDTGYARLCEVVARCMIELHGARVHWGKFFPITAVAARGAYPGAQEFERVCLDQDPNRLFWYG